MKSINDMISVHDITITEWNDDEHWFEVNGSEKAQQEFYNALGKAFWKWEA